ncbi:MAG: ATP-binding protein [Ignavibacteria bacterium]|nr:ATP-binding protein [Ignavibacteria bacterium]
MEKKDFLSPPNIETFQELPDSKPLVVVGKNSEILYTNNSFRKSFQIKEGMSFEELKSEPNLENLLTVFSQSNFNGFHFDLFLFPDEKLEINHYYVEVDRIFIESREYFFLTFQTSNEKQKLESRINDLHDALEYGKIPVIITDENGNINYATRMFEKILKNSIDEIFYQPIALVLSNNIIDADFNEINEAIHRTKRWTKEISYFDDKKGHIFLELNLNPVYRDGTDLLNFILTAHDITSHILKNQIAKKSAESLLAIINNISDLLLIIKKENNEWTFNNANENFFQTFSLIKANCLNRKLESVLEAAYLKEIFAAVTKLKNLSLKYAEFFYDHSNKRKYSGKVTGIVSDTEEFFIISLKDITDQLLYELILKKAYEKEIHLNKLKTAFLENMSHEIRTPYNAILGYSEIIDDCLQVGEFDTIKEISVFVKEVLDRVLNLFTNIVEVSQIESGEVQVDKVVVNCHEILKSVYNKKTLAAKAKGLDFKLEVEQHEVLLSTDWIKFEKIIFSIVDNAIKYTETGSVIIGASSHDGRIIISVSDTGKGMDVTMLSRLFEPFTQEEEGYARNFEGAGLGLTIAYGLTKLLGGEMEFESSKETGTKVLLIFPQYN